VDELTAGHGETISALKFLEESRLLVCGTKDGDRMLQLFHFFTIIKIKLVNQSRSLI
jgi:hypothetical protein